MWDSNPLPIGYEPSALTSWATSPLNIFWSGMRGSNSHVFRHRILRPARATNFANPRNIWHFCMWLRTIWRHCRRHRAGCLPCSPFTPRSRGHPVIVGHISHPRMMDVLVIAVRNRTYISHFPRRISRLCYWATNFGAACENRTRIFCLEGSGFTIKLMPHESV